MTLRVEPSSVLCGFYADFAPLKSAWRELFAALPPGVAPRALRVGFAVEVAAFLDEDFYCGQICAYPLLKHLRQTHTPICAPAFTARGCTGGDYSSWLIAAAARTQTAPLDFQGGVAAVNHMDSNSGMSALRHTLAAWRVRAPFFSRVSVTGSHLASMQAVAEGRADIAAIDAASFALICAHRPTLVDAIQIIAQSAASIAPAFVVKTEHAARGDAITHALNAALEASPDCARVLHLQRFVRVNWDDFARTQALIDEAADAGYPEIA